MVGCYKLFTEETTWEKAEQACKAENAHLASVSSEDEQEMIYQVSVCTQILVHHFGRYISIFENKRNYFVMTIQNVLFV